jgi:RNA polymerase sigma factor (TIGR02999 family)
MRRKKKNTSPSQNFYRVSSQNRDIILAMQISRSLTGELRLFSTQDAPSKESLLREILPRLREIAAWRIAGRGARNTITPTELIGETWLSRLHKGKWKIDDREHFFSIVGLAMEQVLTDMARKRVAQKRGSGAAHLSLQELSPCREPVSAEAEQVIAIGLLMEQLAKADPLAAQIVRAHYFAGYGLEEIARESGLSLRQVRHRWEKGKLWLAERLR